MNPNNTSTITKPMTIRCKNETVEYFRGKPLNRVVESLHEKIEDGDIEIEGGEIVVYRELEEECKRLGIKPKSVVDAVVKDMQGKL